MQLSSLSIELFSGPWDADKEGHHNDTEYGPPMPSRPLIVINGMFTEIRFETDIAWKWLETTHRRMTFVEEAAFAVHGPRIRSTGTNTNTHPRFQRVK